MHSKQLQLVFQFLNQNQKGEKVTVKRKGNNKQENTLYLQLKKDMRNQNKREYIPVAVFQHPENIKIEYQKKRFGKQRILSLLGTIVK